MAVTVVSGPPAAGKSSWVADHAAPDDLVIDLDVIAGGHDRSPSETHEAWLKVQELEAQASSHDGDVWVIRCAPKASDRAALAERLGASRVVVVPTPAGEAKRRAVAADRPSMWASLIDRWWAEYEPADFDELVPAMGATNTEAAMADDTPTDDADAPDDDAQPEPQQRQQPPRPAAKDDSDDLAEAGRRALDAERKARRDADKQLKAAMAELDKLRQQNMTETERAIAEAKAQGRQEALVEATGRLVRAEVRAAAGGKLADPDDAAMLLGDLSEYVSSSGDVDSKAISKAIDELVKQKPYLAPQGTRPAPLPGGGATPSNGASMDDWIRNAASRR